ncbi:MAG: radical SAM protein [Candidatus Omnitrophota bacterium]|nr:radical SAM protein [Candidatus Omnitrophota bacterium]
MQAQLTQEETKTKFSLNCVYLYFSKYCNLRCRHCWIDPEFSTDRTPKDNELDVKSLFLALDECQKLGMNSVKITGGEPFLRADIFELLDYIKDRNLNVTFETNATLIKQKEARALKQVKVSQVAVSIDGPNARIHELLRGIKGSFAEAIEGIKFLKEHNLNVQLIISLWRQNKDYLKSVIELSRSLGVNSVKINIISCIARADKMLKDQEVLSVKEVIDCYKQLMQQLQKEPAFAVHFDIPPAFQPLKNGRLRDLYNCSILNILGILADGRLSICGIGDSLDTLVLGKVGQDSIKDIWCNHPILEDIRKNVPYNLKGVCGKCILRYYCLGKCRAEAFYAKGSFVAPFSFCQQAYEQGLFPISRLI